MKIKPQDVGHFKSVAQAQSYENALETRERYGAVVHDLVALDNSPHDKNAERGKVVLLNTDLGRALRSGQKSHNGYGTPLKVVNAEMEYSPETLRVRELSLSSQDNDMEARAGRSWGGLGPVRTKVWENDGSTNHGPSQTCYFADGTITRKTEY